MKQANAMVITEHGRKRVASEDFACVAAHLALQCTENDFRDNFAVLVAVSLLTDETGFVESEDDSVFSAKLTHFMFANASEIIGAMERVTASESFKQHLEGLRALAATRRKGRKI